MNKLKDTHLWLKGAEFLSESCDAYPTCGLTPFESLLEARVLIAFVAGPVIDIAGFCLLQRFCYLGPAGHSSNRAR